MAIPLYDIFFDQAIDTPYIRDLNEEQETSDILVRDHAGHCRPFSQMSPLTASLTRQLTFRRLHVSPEYHSNT